MEQPVSVANGTAAAAAPQEPKRMYCTYDSVHSAIATSFDTLHAGGWSKPDYLLAIAGGGLIPARILRSILRNASKSGCATIKVIGLELYDDDLDGKERETGVVRTQWLETEETKLVGKRILIVDEVDDSRQTLAYAVRELKSDIKKQEEALRAAGQEVPETQLAVFVIHNKEKPKKGSLPEDVHEFVAQKVEGDPWIVYPWDAYDIHEHNRLGSPA